MKYLLILPSGASFRNFLCTPFVDYLLRDGEVRVWHGLPEESIVPFRQRWGEKVRWDRLPPLDDPALERLIRQAKVFAQFYWQNRLEPDVQLKRFPRSYRWIGRLREKTARAIGWCFSTARGVVTLDRLHQWMAERAPHFPEYDRFIREARPDFVFCTFQKSLEAVPAIRAARRLKIPTATFVYSWDNLPKGRMPIAPDYYLVWSDFMKAELLGYYPDVAPQRIRTVGTPQFESYQDRGLIRPREEFFSSLGLDPKRPVVCFSGDDLLTSPYDPHYLDDLAAAMAKVPMERRPQIVFRRCPVDWSSRYDAVLDKHPEIVVSDPLWRPDNGDWKTVMPTAEDVALLVNLVYHVDAVVNLGSTMAMDFAVYDKPGIYIAYNPRAADGHWNVHDSYLLPHLRSVHELQPVHWARSAEELGDVVLRALEFPREKSSARQAWLHRHVQQPMGEASERISRELRALAARGPWTEAS